MDNWGYQRFVDYIQERIDDETKHINLLLDRIQLLGGVPAAGLNEVKFAGMVDGMLINDEASEVNAIAHYNETIQLCISEGDDDTHRLLETILADETDHLHDIESRLTQLAQMGVQNFLANQV